MVTQDRVLDTFNKITAAFFVVMIALSSVGLMVGGVGVVAIMMISVTERTREIGVRKALGATRREIMFQFLVEAATLTLVGCIVGMALGALIAWAIRSFTPIPAAVPLLSVVAAVLASILTGVLFGLYPGEQGITDGSGRGVAVRIDGQAERRTGGRNSSTLRPSVSPPPLRPSDPPTLSTVRQAFDISGSPEPPPIPPSPPAPRNRVRQ